MRRRRAQVSRRIGLFLAAVWVGAAGAGVGAQESKRVEKGSPSSSRAAGAATGTQQKAKSAQAAPSPRKPPAPAARIRAPQGFMVEQLYSVPRETQGSWVNMTVDPKGRLIVSDQYGKLYRVVLPPVGGDGGVVEVAAIDAPVGEAHGLLWAFDSLYVVVNEGRRYRSGLYRVSDSDGDDRLDKVERLRVLDGGGEHGPHAVVLAPDGKSLFVVAGNATRLTEITGSPVPRVWGEDNLLAHMVDGSGFMTGEKAPGGCIYRVSPDGKEWQLFSMGYRNPFDMAFNADGELFTYDSDMEWDVNMPWYRPTRVLHVTSGSEFGYRNGSGKWPPYYIDNLPPVANVGPGSPTGVTFGYGTRFPAKYQRALYLCDWSYGKLYALHLEPKGASYGGELEEFVSGTPLALTDIVVNPMDGAMYFAVGGRNTQSGLYRVTYASNAPVAAAPPVENAAAAQARALRHKLEALHGRKDAKAVETAWPYLGHSDRFIRWAARLAIEAQDVTAWRDKALSEQSTPEASLNALLALARVSAGDPAHRHADAKPPEPALRRRILGALDRIPWEILGHAERVDLLRVYQVVLNRFGPLDQAAADRLARWFNAYYPSRSRELNSELAQLLVYLQAPDAAAKTVALLVQAPTQEEQIDFARDLRLLKPGWTPELHKTFFAWLNRASEYKGGNSFRGFMANIRRDALANMSDAEKAELKPIIEAKAGSADAPIVPDRPFVKKWTLDELSPLVETGLKNRDFDRGRMVFAAAKCFSCHRYNDEGGGLGPDLSGIAGRFSVRDLLESIVLPSKTISDQYEAVIIATEDGRIVTGRIVNLHGEDLTISPDMLAPNRMVHVRRGNVVEMKRSPVSLMPDGLLNTLNRDEVLDLIAYLLSRGDRDNPMFKKSGNVGAATGGRAMRRIIPAGRTVPARALGSDSEVFFNGTDLTGWEGLTDYWSVRDGTIVGHAPADGLKFHTFLCSKKRYRDFELSVEVRIKDGKGNSGVQFRSRILDAAKFTVAGPQADLGKPFWGGLYGQVDPGHWLKLPPQRVVLKVIKPAEFNELKLRCVGDRVTIKLNGETTIDDHFPELPDEGIIAWQLHEGYTSMEVTLKNIDFKELAH
jgi:putative heme-binding domain-containing protein